MARAKIGDRDATPALKPTQEVTQTIPGAAEISVRRDTSGTPEQSKGTETSVPTATSGTLEEPKAAATTLPRATSSTPEESKLVHRSQTKFMSAAAITKLMAMNDSAVSSLETESDFHSLFSSQE